MADPILPWGSDGATPILDPSPLWRPWAKKDIWLGGEAGGKYIPKIGDYVEDTDYHITYEVTAHDERYVPTLNRITPRPIADMDSEDLLLGQDSGTYRVFIDKSVMPHRLQVDARCYVNARNASAARVYRGNPVNGAPDVVSLVLDQAGLPIGTLIPLAMSKMPNGLNAAQYYIPTAYTTTDIKDGEFLYAELYDDTGAVLSSRALRAVVSTFTATSDLSIKAVTGIALEGPLMSKLVPNRMEVPLNLTLNSMNLTGIVSYNSGAPLPLNVDGGRFELLGLKAFMPTQAGQHMTMTLKYNLAQGEVSYLGSQVGVNRFVTKDIDVLVVDVENQLTVKLLAYPVWISPVAGYRLRWFLCNLDRNVFYDVTSIVEIGEDSLAFDPTLYGSKQQITVALDLSKVNGSWRAWRFVQKLSITLMRAGNQNGTKWRIAFDPNQTPEYGDNLFIRSRFINQNLSEIDLTSGFANMGDWLQAFYYNTKPIIDPMLEEEPVVPSHIVFTDGGGVNQVKLAIADYWNKRFATNFGVTQDSTWFIKFVKQGATDDLVLSVAGAPVTQVVAW